MNLLLKSITVQATRPAGRVVSIRIGMVGSTRPAGRVDLTVSFHIDTTRPAGWVVGSRSSL